MFQFHRLRLASAAALAALLLLSACETSKQARSETANPNKSEKSDLALLNSPNRLVAAVEEGKVQYRVPRQQLMQNFTRQFNDGTVVDRAMVRKVQNSPKDKPRYYMVGMGLNNGMFRAMALPLELSTDNELYLSSQSERYVLEGRGCQMCYFNFEDNQIAGTTCEDNSGGGTCDMTVLEQNTFFGEAKK